MKTSEKRIIDATVEEMTELILNRVKKELEILARELKPKPVVEWMTRNQVKRHLKVSLVTLHNWDKSGKLKSYKLDGTVRYKKHEVDEHFKK